MKLRAAAILLAVMQFLGFLGFLGSADLMAQPAEEPRGTRGTDPAAPELSTIVVPIRADLGSLSPELELRVPKTFAGKETQQGIDVRYDVARDPILLKMIGPGLHSTTTVRYALEACRGRFPCISCGYGQPRREALVTLHTKLEWDPTWRIRSKTTLLPVHYPKRCQVTWFDFDITKRYVAPVIEQQLGIAAQTIDKNIPAHTSLGATANQIWTSLQLPVELAPRTWLVLEPVGLSLTPITGAGIVATSTLALQARTRVVIGEKPPTIPRPLPALRVAQPPAGGMRVPFDLELPFADATRLLTQELAGKTYKVDGRDLIVEQIRVAPGAGGKLAVVATIDYRGGTLRSYRGLVNLEGTPQFDAATSTVVIPDLDYALAGRRNPFFRLAERVVHDSLRARLRDHARFSLATRITQVRAELTRALNRQLASGVFLRGRAEAIQPLSVTPLPSVMSIRIVATGAAEVEIKQLK